ncbi:unnamed protein product [Cochlearia groenlandica]
MPTDIFIGGEDSSGDASKHNSPIKRLQTKRTREQPWSEEIASIVLGESLANTSDSNFEMKSKKLNSCVASSYQTIDCSNQPDHEDIRDKTPKDVTSGSNKARPFIPTGPGFQAEIPIWIAPTKKGKFYGSPGDSNTLRWLGTGVWPTFSLKKKAQHKGVGEGRHDSCSCPSPGSSSCIKQHKKETRENLEKELGCEFYTMEFDRMGEVVSNSWTTKEKQRFNSLAKKNPLKSCERLWEIASTAFPRKSEKNLISYYHNVFLVNRMRMLANSCGGHIDSDDDQNSDFLGQSRYIQ